ncbi:MAG: hypothetical protein JSS02_18270 [Planctomycetes bacterium]|nr:hypothetical protein [Planctomycetota bacterium]
MPTLRRETETVPDLVYRIAQAELAQGPPADPVAALLFVPPDVVPLTDVSRPQTAPPSPPQTTDNFSQPFDSLAEPAPWTALSPRTSHSGSGNDVVGLLHPPPQRSVETGPVSLREVPSGARVHRAPTPQSDWPTHSAKPPVSHREPSARAPAPNSVPWAVTAARPAVSAPPVDVSPSPLLSESGAAPSLVPAFEPQIPEGFGVEPRDDRARQLEQSLRDFTATQSDLLAAIHERLAEHDRLWLEQQALRRAGR